MVENYNPKYNSDIITLLNSVDNDFYITENNIRLKVKKEKDLKKLIRQSKNQQVIFDKGDCLGIILEWKSLGAIEPRYYIKIISISDDIADRLLTCLLWNTKNNLFIEIKKSSPLIRIFKNKNFEFRGDRGKEILLFRKYKKPIYEHK